MGVNEGETVTESLGVCDIVAELTRVMLSVLDVQLDTEAVTHTVAVDEVQIESD